VQTRWAVEWAKNRGIPFDVYMADWEGLGRKAGPIRNQQMLVEGKPDLVVAFPGGKGTAGMVTLPRDAGVDVILVDPGAASSLTIGVSFQ